MPVVAADRPLPALREETIDQLVCNYGHGELSLEAFERRLEQAMEAQSHAELVALTEDLDLVVAERFKQQRATEFRATASSSAKPTDFLLNVLGGSQRKGVWDVAEKITVVNLLGGTDLDFSEARFIARTTYVRVFCLLGGIDIRVPEGIHTVSKVTCILGGMDNRGPTSSHPNAPTLVIEGIVLLGGADIKTKKPLKARLIEFAERIRKMFAAPSSP